MNYSSELAAVMQRMVLISEIATFSRLPLPAEHIRNNVTWREKQLLMPNDDETSESDVPASSNELEFLDLNSIRINAKTESQQNEGEVLKPSEVQPSKSDASNGQSEGVRSEYTENEKQLIIDLLERWEDPERVNREMVRCVKLSSVPTFQAELTCFLMLTKGKESDSWCCASVSPRLDAVEEALPIQSCLRAGPIQRDMH